MIYASRTIILRSLLALSTMFLLTSGDRIALPIIHGQQQNISVSTNEGSAIKSLRLLLSAENTYKDTVGKGEYGLLTELGTSNLIGASLARGKKDGYLFTIVVKKSTMTTHPAIDLVARPDEYGKTGRRSFYLTEVGVLLTSDVKDAPLSSMRPFAKTGSGTNVAEAPGNESKPPSESSDEENAFRISANEAAAIEMLVAIHSAETKYVARLGAGAYGTLDELAKAGLIDKTHLASIQKDYEFEVKITAGKAESRATFGISASPKAYGETGRRAFFIDQTGVVRGGDKEGGASDVTDPPIDGSNTSPAITFLSFYE